MGSKWITGGVVAASRGDFPAQRFRPYLQFVAERIDSWDGLTA